jgi:D-glycero-D-manno-heptose 1,7-bisphosphate phosphatase
VRRSLPRAVLFDRDGTLCVDVPYNGDPDRLVLVPGAAAAVEQLHAAGIRTAVISNQSGVGRGLVTRRQVDAVNRRLRELIGRVGPILVCPHRSDDGCSCRKPMPGLVLEAAAALSMDPAECVVIGDIGADLGAAAAAGARAVLVPTEMTRDEEIAEAYRVAAVAPDLTTAVALVLSGSLPALDSRAAAA